MKGRISKRVLQENKAHQISEKRTFLIPDRHTYVRVSGGKKCSFIGKFIVLYFLVTPVLRFALWPYYRRNVFRRSNVLANTSQPTQHKTVVRKTNNNCNSCFLRLSSVWTGCCIFVLKSYIYERSVYNIFTTNKRSRSHFLRNVLPQGFFGWFRPCWCLFFAPKTHGPLNTGIKPYQGLRKKTYIQIQFIQY